MTHTDIIAEIRRTILEEPDLDLHRLALADALLDSDDPRDRAEGEFVAASMTYDADRCQGNCEIVGNAWNRVAPQILPHDPRFVVLEVDGRVEVFSRDSLSFRRGLPHTWAVADVPTFEREAKDVFARHPIRRVVLRCKVHTPLVMRSRFTAGDTYYPGDVSVWALWRLLRPRKKTRTQADYNSNDIVRADLERACVVYGESTRSKQP